MQRFPAASERAGEHPDADSRPFDNRAAHRVGGGIGGGFVAEPEELRIADLDGPGLLVAGVSAQDRVAGAGEPDGVGLGVDFEQGGGQYAQFSLRSFGLAVQEPGRGGQNLFRAVELGLQQQTMRFADLCNDAVAHLSGPAVDDSSGDEDPGDEQNEQDGARDEQSFAMGMFFSEHCRCLEGAEGGFPGPGIVFQNQLFSVSEVSGASSA